jgi:hypothetical protein
MKILASPWHVLLVSLLGFLPVVALFVIGGDSAFSALSRPQEVYDLVSSSPGRIAWIVLGSLGDAVGYYLVLLPFAVQLLKRARSAAGRVGTWLILLYAANGAFWAVASAVALPIAARADAATWAKVTTVCQTLGWGTIGNTLGSLGWLGLGIHFLKPRRGFAVFTLLLGVMYFLGGQIASAFVPASLAMAGISFYLIFQLIVWNPWFSIVAREASGAPAGVPAG